MKRGFFALANADTPTLYIYDDIGPSEWGMVDAKTVIGSLEGFGEGENITVRINSQGGDVFEAFAIYNALASHAGAVSVHVDSLAASAASVIAMAGDSISIAANAYMMIHDPWTVAIGNAGDMRKTADVLDKITGTIVEMYAARAGDKTDAATLRNAMAEESWLTAEESVEMGLAESVGQALKVAANVDAGMFARCPLAASMTSRSDRPDAATRARLIAAKHGVRGDDPELAAVRARLAKRRNGCW